MPTLGEKIEIAQLCTTMQEMSMGLDETLGPSFISKTQQLLDDRVTETHTFLDASLCFNNGSAMWRLKPVTEFDGLFEIPVKSPEHAYGLFKRHYFARLAAGSIASSIIPHYNNDDFTRGVNELLRYVEN
jgi:hypothetical protein